MVNVGKFAAFVSYLTDKFHIRFSDYNCEDILAMIRNMNENVITPIKVDFQTVDHLMMLLNEGTQKIEAIKTYRQKAVEFYHGEFGR